MKAGNWLYQSVRHTRTGDRVFKYGTIHATCNGIELQSDGKYMEIKMNKSEVLKLIEHLNKITIPNIDCDENIF